MSQILGPLAHILRLIAAIPLMLLAVLVIPIMNLLGLNKKSAGPDYVAKYLERFLAGTEGEWDWDDFCSVPLRDPHLDSIREQVCDLGPPNPIGDSERAKLRELLNEVQTVGRVETA